MKAQLAGHIDNPDSSLPTLGVEFEPETASIVVYIDEDGSLSEAKLTYEQVQQFAAMVASAQGDMERFNESLKQVEGNPWDPDDLAKIRVREAEDEDAYYSRCGFED